MEKIFSHECKFTKLILIFLLIEGYCWGDRGAWNIEGAPRTAGLVFRTLAALCPMSKRP